jgi:hypothetical protein
MVYQNNVGTKDLSLRARSLLIISAWFSTARELTEASIIPVHSHFL